jgi:DNA transformation protein
MPITEKYLLGTLQKLQSAKPVTHKKMFGGAGLYCDGVFFAVIDDDRVFFKVDDTNRSEYTNAKMQQWVPDPRTGQAMAYYEVPKRVLSDPKELEVWIDKAVAVAVRKKSKKSK